MLRFATSRGGHVAQWIEHQISNLLVAGSSPVMAAALDWRVCLKNGDAFEAYFR